MNKHAVRPRRPTGAAARAAFPLSTAQTDGRTHSLDPLPQSLFSLSLSRGFKPHLHAAVLQLACEVAYRVPIAAAAGGGGGDGETDGDFPKVDKRPEGTDGRTDGRTDDCGGWNPPTDATDADEGSVRATHARARTHTLT